MWGRLSSAGVWLFLQRWGLALGVLCLPAAGENSTIPKQFRTAALMTGRPPAPPSKASCSDEPAFPSGPQNPLCMALQAGWLDVAPDASPCFELLSSIYLLPVAGSGSFSSGLLG